jgi:deazaflavin-dependent oxidoreductase (nitroreductase family)
MAGTPTRRTRIAWRFWRIVNPVVRPLAGIVPWWLLLETTGRKTGQHRATPLANGPIDDGVLQLISVHGARAAFALNIAADPRVRVKRRGRWLTGTAEVAPLDETVVKRFSAYGRLGLRSFGEDARLIRIRLDG